MPFNKLTDEQLDAVVVAYQELMELPGVTMVEVDFVDYRRTEPGILVYVDACDLSVLAQLPTSVAGVPVLARLENRKTSQVIETIDPRENGGDWPDYPVGRADCQ